MDLLFYIPPSSEAENRLHEVVEMAASTAKVAVYQSMRNFIHRLCRPASRPEAAVLLIKGKEDFLQMVSVRSLLIETPLILILPDRKESTTALGFTFYPRFMTYADGNLQEVEAVLEQMLDNYTKNRYMGLLRKVILKAS